jgi:hypothetical protein
MWSSVTLAAALAIAQPPAGGLKLTNGRFTLGELGPVRATNKLPSGDVLFLAYDIEGLPADAAGVVRYTMGLEVQTAGGKIVLPADPKALEDFLPLGGNKFPARAFLTLGLDQEAGQYAVKVTVTDPRTKASATLTQPFEVLKRGYGITTVYTSYDQRGAQYAPSTGVVGQTLYVQFSVADFQRDAKTKQPNVELEFQVVDAAGKPTLAQPRKRVVDDGVDETVGAIPDRFPLFLSRSGKFTLKIKATDKAAGGKVATYDLPVTVLPDQ